MRSHEVEKVLFEILDIQRRDNVPYTGKLASRENLAQLVAAVQCRRGVYIGQKGEYYELLQQIPSLKLMDTVERYANIQFYNKSLDFIYIDSHTDFDNIIQDLITWVPKVRSGGIIAGSNFCWPCNDVVLAVEAFTRGNNVPVWYLTTLDPVPSWLWVKR